MSDGALEIHVHIPEGEPRLLQAVPAPGHYCTLLVLVPASECGEQVLEGAGGGAERNKALWLFSAAQSQCQQILKARTQTNC